MFHCKRVLPDGEAVDYSWVIYSAAKIESVAIRGVMRGARGAIPREPSHYEGAKSLRGRQKVPTMSQVLSSIQ